MDAARLPMTGSLFLRQVHFGSCHPGQRDTITNIKAHFICIMPDIPILSCTSHRLRGFSIMRVDFSITVEASDTAGGGHIRLGNGSHCELGNSAVNEI